MSELSELRKLSDAAAAGIWYPVGAMIEVEDDKVPDPASCNPELYGQGFEGFEKLALANAEFIALLVNAFRAGNLHTTEELDAAVLAAKQEGQP